MKTNREYFEVLQLFELMIVPTQLQINVIYWALTDQFVRNFVKRNVFLYKQEDTRNKLRELRTGRDTRRRWEYDIMTRDSKSTHRFGQRFGLIQNAASEKPKVLNVSSQCSVNDSSPSSVSLFLCLSLSHKHMQPVRPFRESYDLFIPLISNIRWTDWIANISDLSQVLKLMNILFRTLMITWIDGITSQIVSISILVYSV